MFAIGSPGACGGPTILPFSGGRQRERAAIDARFRAKEVAAREKAKTAAPKKR
jgi:hypothetical protein